MKPRGRSITGSGVFLPSTANGPVSTHNRFPTGSQPGMAVPNPSANATQRAAMDTIVQGALVDLLQSCGVAVAPQPRGRLNLAQLTIPEVSSAIGFTLAQGPNGTPSPGKLTLSLPDALFGIMKADTARRPQPFDWVRELTNQLAARVKHRLLPLGAAMQPMLPSLITRETLEASRARFPNMRVYLGRTLRGDLLVTLDTVIDESRLNYTGPVEIGDPGDVIIF
ncbi:MAG: hypothetical protein ABW061_20520 [Polyangiaceae bacterium]